MTPVQRKQIARLLDALERELSQKEPKRLEPNRKDETEVGGDEDEQPLNEMLQVIASNRNRTSAQVLAKIAKAKRKLREAPEDFGLCEGCDEEILFGRLEAMPWAELCTDCQRREDGHKGPATRRHLTDYR